MPTDFSQLPQLVEGLSTIASIMERLGVPGLVALVLSGPAAVLITALVLEYLRTRHNRSMLETYRADMETQRKEMALLVERNRADTQSILRDLGSKHAEVAQYYRDNADLVRDYERIADAMQTIVVNNTRVVERLTVIVEARRQA